MLVVERVRRSFGAVEAVRDVSFTCAPGTVLGLLGPNGAGKTTTMRIILGIYPPDAGSIAWNGRTIDRELRRTFGYLPEERGLYAKMPVREQIEYFARLHGLDERAAQQRTAAWIERLALGEYAKRTCSELSKGNQQKVQLACAVVHDPVLLILDEPFSGLDPLNAEIMVECLRALAERGTTLLLSSHQMWQIENLCREFCIVAAGTVRLRGSLDELRRSFPTRAVKVAPDLPAIRAVFAASGAAEPHAEDGGLTYVLPAGTDFGALLRAAVAAGDVREFERREPSLNEIYVRALGTQASPAVNEIGIVFAAEFARKLRSRVYLVATLGGALMVAFLVEAPSLFSHASLDSTSDIVLAGPAALRQRAAALMEAKDDFRVVASLERLPQPVTLGFLDVHRKAAAALELSVQHHKLHVDVYPRDLAAYDEIEFRVLAPLSVEVATGLPSAEVAPALKVVRVIHPLDRKFVDAKSATFAHGVAFGLIFILYFSIIIASQSVMASVAEEKTSRIAELLVATISPVNLLTAKTLAAAALALLQIGVWVTTALVLLPRAALSLAGPKSALGPDSGTQLLAFDPGELIAFAIFFLLGFFQYATIYAAAASLISRTEDLGSVATPVILPVVGAFFIAQFTLLQPNSPLAVAFSFVPFISPFVIFSRIAISLVPWWQIALAVAINLATVAVCFYLGGKVYRVGMLLYGNAPSLRQVWAALRA